MTGELLTVHSWPHLERPLLVMGLEGWIDAGQAGATAMGGLLATLETTPMATFDTDALIDLRARRPVLRIANGVEAELRWPELRLDVATEPGGRSLLLLHGPEPDMRWNQFTREVLGLVERLGVNMAVGLGAFPAPVPHTRPVRLAATSTDAELAARVGFIPATIEVPAGMQGALDFALGNAGVASLALWARVPHYATALPYPAASAALLDCLAGLCDLELDTSALHGAAEATGKQIEELIRASPEHVSLVEQLERQHDAEEGLAGTDFGELPSADELADELQRFLRNEHGQQ